MQHSLWFVCVLLLAALATVAAGLEEGGGQQAAVESNSEGRFLVAQQEPLTDRVQQHRAGRPLETVTACILHFNDAYHVWLSLANQLLRIRLVCIANAPGLVLFMAPCAGQRHARS